MTRLGRWIDFENDYKTLDPSFMESVWWVFSQLFNKGLVYKGFKVRATSQRWYKCCVAWHLNRSISANCGTLFSNGCNQQVLSQMLFLKGLALSATSPRPLAATSPAC